MLNVEDAFDFITCFCQLLKSGHILVVLNEHEYILRLLDILFDQLVLNAWIAHHGEVEE